MLSKVPYNSDAVIFIKKQTACQGSKIWVLTVIADFIWCHFVFNLYTNVLARNFTCTCISKNKEKWKNGNVHYVTHKKVVNFGFFICSCTMFQYFVHS